MNNQRRSLEPSDFERANWEEVAAEVDDGARLHHFARAYREAARKAAEDDEATAAVYEELANLCSFTLRPDQDRRDPFLPIIRAAGTRTAVVNDLSPATVEGCSRLAESAPRLRLQAQMADVAWVAKRDHESAEAAIRTYLEIVQTTSLPDDWTRIQAVLERSFQIARELGSEGPRDEVLSQADALLSEHGPAEDGFFCAHIIQLIHNYNLPDDSGIDLIDLAEDIGERAYDNGGYRVARRYWELAMDLAAAQERRPLAKRAAERPYAHRIADAFESEAKLLLDQGAGHLQAADCLRRAIEALRRVGDEDERIEELHRRLVEVQEGAPGELAEVCHSTDITALVVKARDRIADQEVGDALRIFAVTPSIPDVDRLRNHAEDLAEDYPLQGLFPKQVLSRTGKVVQRYGSVQSSDTEEREAALRGDMLYYASLHHDHAAQATINPMRVQILREHALQRRTFIRVLRYNPMVASGREAVCARGLVAGFHADLTTALHLLLPQFEHSIRLLLDREGLRTSTLDDEGVQREMGLNRLLFVYEEELEEIFSQDVVFALQGLLVEKFGGDFRNKVAHGLGGAGDYNTGPAMYLWWLIFRLCLTPALNAVTTVEDEG